MENTKVIKIPVEDQEPSRPVYITREEVQQAFDHPDLSVSLFDGLNDIIHKRPIKSAADLLYQAQLIERTEALSAYKEKLLDEVKALRAANTRLEQEKAALTTRMLSAESKYEELQLNQKTYIGIQPEPTV